MQTSRRTEYTITLQQEELSLLCYAADVYAKQLAEKNPNSGAATKALELREILFNLRVE